MLVTSQMFLNIGIGEAASPLGLVEHEEQREGYMRRNRIVKTKKNKTSSPKSKKSKKKGKKGKKVYEGFADRSTLIDEVNEYCADEANYNSETYGYVSVFLCVLLVKIECIVFSKMSDTQC